MRGWLLLLITGPLAVAYALVAGLWAFCSFVTDALDWLLDRITDLGRFVEKRVRR